MPGRQNRKPQQSEAGQEPLRFLGDIAIYLFEWIFTADYTNKYYNNSNN